MSGQNSPNWFASPMKDLRLVTSLGTGKFLRASIFTESDLIPLRPTMKRRTWPLPLPELLTPTKWYHFFCSAPWQGRHAPSVASWCRHTQLDRQLVYGGQGFQQGLGLWDHRKYHQSLSSQWELWGRQNLPILWGRLLTSGTSCWGPPTSPRRRSLVSRRILLWNLESYGCHSRVQMGGWGTSLPCFDAGGL